MSRVLFICFVILLSPGCDRQQTSHPHDEGHHDEEGVVHVKEESQRLIGLELMKAEKKTFVSAIEVTGEIAKETENMSHIVSPEPGFLKSYRANLGDTVEKGTPVCEVESRAGKLLEITSPGHGIVFAQYLKLGDAVDVLTSIMTVADPDLLRASLNVYEKDLAGIKLGQKVLIESVAYPEKSFDGKLAYISPSVDDKTRTIKIRVDVGNKEHLLKFGMFVTGRILEESKEQYYVVPTRAIHFMNGKRAVFVKTGEDQFQAREVKVQEETKEEAAIREGLCEGDSVVVQESFLLKSELLKSEMGAGCAE
ncbi:MAG: efflux RND transporter periplasmic adaptor subunit [Candidatus Omnitrophota bacterium]|jgi:multidrug efflux pump subunit AcrA (membrane-fusion protein)